MFLNCITHFVIKENKYLNINKDYNINCQKKWFNVN